MATGEKGTIVKTFIQVTYTLDTSKPVPDDHLLRREIHRVKDEDTVDIVVVSDTTKDVGNKDDWQDQLEDEKDSLETAQTDTNDSFDDQIEIVQEQIDEIDTL